MRVTIDVDKYVFVLLQTLAWDVLRRPDIKDILYGAATVMRWPRVSLADFACGYTTRGWLVSHYERSS
jgi:hypothetical protein